jgi:hypothetical protein
MRNVHVVSRPTFNALSNGALVFLLSLIYYAQEIIKILHMISAGEGHVNTYVKVRTGTHRQTNRNI